MAANQDVSIVRPPHHIENVRQDAIAAAERRAAQYGGEPSHLISDTISWALGGLEQAPFTGTATPDGAGGADVANEITACRAYLQSTSSTEANSEPIGRAWRVLEVLEWLTGADDKPPTYRRETQPGDLVGGHGRIVRPYIVIRRQVLFAQARLATGEISGGRGPDWHQGVIATLEWAEGERVTPPMAHTGGTVCTHPDSSGPPSHREIARERGAAEEHLEPLGYRHGDISPAYADAVACTVRWLYGGTTEPPEDEEP